MSHRPELTVPREHVLAALQKDSDWTAAGQQLQIPPGLAFMIATGVPADGSGVPEVPHVDNAPELASPQSLVNARGHNPRSNATVDAWVRRRAARELTR
ncbi:MAG TPA: hypothetical protein VFN48_07625 [Solirubrobacteraceae bacterium]|nr:hypothetical protein [Solirubrobacteraceae bacterium]